MKGSLVESVMLAVSESTPRSVMTEEAGSAEFRAVPEVATLAVAEAEVDGAVEAVAETTTAGN